MIGQRVIRNSYKCKLFFTAIMKKIICLVGMPGSGKSMAAKMLEEHGYSIVRFGDVTDEELKKRGLSHTEDNEKAVREELRQRHGMEAYAKLNLPRIRQQEKAVVDGLYSYEEYELLKHEFSSLALLAVEATLEKRHSRLMARPLRPFSKEECIARDKAQIEKLNIKKTIEKAQITIENNGSEEELRKAIKALLKL